MTDAKQRARRRWNRRVLTLKLAAFFLTLAILGLIGLLWFLRPEQSALEKRTLTAFPKLTWSSFWDGSFFSQVDTWYADTYPLRETLISGNMALREAYGLRDRQIVGGGQQTADAIPPEGETPPVTQPPETDSDETQPLEDGTITTPAEAAGSIYIAGNSGFGLYYFSQSAASCYCSLVNSAYAGLKDTGATVYTLVAPISAGVMLEQSVQDSMGCSNERDAIEWMYSQMDAGVHCVRVFDNLKQHNAEYIYFHTDHHWTALGAYYAYEEFAKEKGMKPHKLDQFETMTFPDFLGTFYSSSNQASALAANPDTVTAYVPNGTNDMQMYVSDGSGGYSKYDWRVVNDVSDYVNSELYATFAGGDQPYNEVHNETITDGSSVLVVKDSYANALIPFLVDHYEHIYWIDYRAYGAYCSATGAGDGTISGLVREKGIDDVLLLNNINSTGSEDLLGYMERVFR